MRDMWERTWDLRGGRVVAWTHADDPGESEGCSHSFRGSALAPFQFRENRTRRHDRIRRFEDGTANHDEAVFEEPARFDLARPVTGEHIGFGRGVHFCLGAPLARLEARVALGALLARVDRVELASAEPWEPRAAFHVHGPSRLALRFRAGS